MGFLLLKKALNGIDTPHFKHTKDMQTEEMPVPAKVNISMQQHMGAMCQPMVKAGDLVKVGQLIGSSDSAVSAPVHSGVSGKVAAIESHTMPDGNVVTSVVIETDGLQEISEGVKPPHIESKEDLIHAVRNSGLVGLGGAGFPTAVKLNVKPEQNVDTLIINAAECEPYITSDHREMLENTQDILDGVGTVVKHLGISRVIIGIESNKPDAIQKMREAVSSESGYSVLSLPTSYPQGAEKVLIYNATGKVVEEGRLPADMGCIMMNVSSAGFLGRYLKTGMPLVRRRMTIDGDAIVNKKNLDVIFGTSVQDIADYCGGFKEEPGKILMGGPMTGIAIYDMNMPVVKNNNAILFLTRKQAQMPKTTACIRCGRCAAVCPFDLSPVAIENAYKLKDTEELAVLKVNLCMECGCCAYVCPAKRDLVLVNRMGKRLLRENKK